ncbi:hypothetical protein RQP46_001780 [Phenoliferia psychrophenolica]
MSARSESRPCRLPLIISFDLDSLARYLRTRTVDPKYQQAGMGLASSRFFGGASLSASDAAATPALVSPLAHLSDLSNTSSLVIWTQEFTSLAPCRVITIPSEIVELILLNLSTDPQTLRTDDEGGWKERHDGLRAASLVSKQWGAVAQRLLYGRLELKWEAVSAENLLRTFEENPGLLQLVRSIVTVFTNSDHWDEEWYESSERDVALKEADLLFPACMDEWSEGRNHKDHEAYVANQLPNLRILCMTSMDMPIRASLLRKLAPVLAQLTTVSLDANNDNALSIFPLLHSVEVVSIFTSHRDPDTPSHQSPPREQRTGQLKYMRVDVADLDVLGLNFTTLVGIELQNVGEVDLFDFTHNLFPTLVNLELLSIRGVTWNDPFSGDTLQYFCKSLSRTKLTELYLSHWPKARHLCHLPTTLETLGLDCRLLPFQDTTKAFGDVPSWKEGVKGEALEVPGPWVVFEHTTGTDAWGNPLYPTSTGSAKISAPTTVTDSSLSCGSDPYSFSDSSSLAVRTEHPLLIAPAYKWACLPKLIAGDSYMSSWNDTIFLNATKFYAMSPTNYSIDGGLSGSGVLDVAREVQLRIKHWAYAWKLTNDTKWPVRAWEELVVASGNSTTQSFGTTGDNWNSRALPSVFISGFFILTLLAPKVHFLDLGEFTAAFAFAYDWMFDYWTDTQKEAIRGSIVSLGLQYGYNVYANSSGAGADYSWWSNNVRGNWNCVCNSGLTLGALAIANEDTSGLASKILAYTVPNANENCAYAPSPDGTWAETANYWYFGTSAHAQMAAALLSATGSTQGLLDSNPGMKLSALYHMYVTGMQGLFAYGDTGPNKYSTTANGIMFYGQQFSIPMYTLFQRDRQDAPEPMSMLFYDPQVQGDFWEGLALDHHFDNTTDAWVSMRSSWTSTEGTYVAMKAGALQHHQTHQDVDAGDFVLDAIGQRWAGELGSGNYLADGYFTSEAQNAERWDYYRKRTEGQNTLLMGGLDQNVLGVPTTGYGSSGDAQTELEYSINGTSVAYFTADLTNMYNGTSVLRAIRMLNGRKQVLLQDEVDVPSVGIQWRMHTNATITLSNNNQTATLKLGGETMVVTLLSPSTAAFGTAEPVRLATDPTLPTDTASQDQPNPEVTVLTIDIPTGQQTVQVLFSPQWPGLASTDYVTPPTVAIADWSLTSHGVQSLGSNTTTSSGGSSSGSSSSGSDSGSKSAASTLAVSGVAVAMGAVAMLAAW